MFHLNGKTFHPVTESHSQTGNCSKLTLIDCTVSGNSANSGGGINNNVATLTVTNSTISGNTANSTSAGILNDSGNATLSNCLISGNKATSVYGGGVTNLGLTTMTNCTVTGNSSLWWGGGIYNMNSSTAELTLKAFAGKSNAGICSH